MTDRNTEFQRLLDSITPATYESLKAAVETGKWPDGRPLSAQQRELSLQAVISYEHKHLPPEQRTGYIHRPSDFACGSEDPEPDADQAIKWQ